ncbi:MAG: Rieske (2Fe-2S) protein [Mariprofundaceae bacterium]|nr:Rieske (2Fe-2S) protein [Mariprofundaceae bacterium]
MHEPRQWQSIAIPDEGEARCFVFTAGEHEEQGFLVRYQGRLHAYRNRCPHAGSTLDWTPGEFFSEDGQALVCQTHGAHFDPANGACIGGPCPRGLDVLPIREENGAALVPAAYDMPPWPIS